VFVPDGEPCTAAQLPAAAKNAASHRGQALRALVAMLGTSGYIRAP
jgi:inosine/xanthosine triphosphate pyrophosphatase family protein